MHLRRLCIPILLLFVWSSSSAQLTFHNWTLEQSRQAASSQDRLFFLYFTAEWCAPCRWMEAHTFKDADLRNYVETHYLAVAVDYDEGAGALLRKQFEVEDIPSILVFSASGQLLERRSGTIKPAAMLAWLQELDQPLHHLEAVRLPEQQASAMASPQAQLGFSRPALGQTQAEETPLLSQTSEHKLILAGSPVLAANEETFIPRDGARYTIILTDTNYSYSEAIGAVGNLEQKYAKRTELHPQPDGRFSIALGEFDNYQAAQAFLTYLRRNDRQGKILTLGR